MRLTLPRSVPARIATGATALAVIVPVGLLGASSTATSATSASVATPTAQADAAAAQTVRSEESMLLSAADLSGGWTEVSLFGHTGQATDLLKSIKVSPASCVEGLTLPVGYQSEAHRVFKQGTSDYGPYLAQGVARFSSAATAKAAVNEAAAKAKTCNHVSVTASQGYAGITISKLMTKKYGSQRRGYTIDAQVMGFMPAQGKVIVVRKGRFVTVVAQGGLGTVPSSAIKAAANKATNLI